MDFHQHRTTLRYLTALRADTDRENFRQHAARTVAENEAWGRYRNALSDLELAERRNLIRSVPDAPTDDYPGGWIIIDLRHLSRGPRAPRDDAASQHYHDTVAAAWPGEQVRWVGVGVDGWTILDRPHWLRKTVWTEDDARTYLRLDSTEEARAWLGAHGVQPHPDGWRAGSVVQAYEDRDYRVPGSVLAAVEQAKRLAPVTMAD